MSISGVSFAQAQRPYGYDPKKGEFTPEQAKQDFKPGIYDPEAEEKAKNRKKKIVKGVIAAAVITAGVLFFTKGKGMDKLKKLWQAIKGKFGKQAEEVAQDITKKVKKAKVKTQKATITTHADLAPKAKVKMEGKDAIHKVRRNRKAIIEATRLREEAEKFTQKELQAYAKEFGYQAPTAEQAKIIAEKHSKQAVNTIADFMQNQGIRRTKDATGKVVLAHKPAIAAPVVEKTAEKAAEKTIDKAAKIAQLQERLAKAEEQIAKYSANGMQRWAKPYETAKANILKEIEVLQGKAPKAAPKAKAVVMPNVTPEQKAAQVAKAWEQLDAKMAKYPTAEEILAKM